MDKILSALNHLDCSELDHADWIRVGMALKNEGYDVNIWDEWSSKDAARYHKGECAKRWKTFRGTNEPVTGATIVKMAQDRGWTPFSGADGVMDWNDVIEFDGYGSDSDPPEPVRTGTEDLILYLQTLYEPDDYVGYVTGDVWQTDDGKWVPSKGVYYRTAGELITSLHRYPDDLGATVGDWKEEAGAWIRFNALDGEGVRNENVVSFRYALVESDSMPIDEQISMYRKLELPIAALVHSGNKSVHAIVRVDADSYDEYRKRVTFLYDFLAAHGVKVDTQNRNPSRLSRMPGVTRKGQHQKLMGVNIGRKSWVDWMDYVDGATDELPGMALLSDYEKDPPELPEELIKGVLRKGHKMLISGSSKAGKSFLLMELCIAIAEGRPWLGFPCKQGKVLYVNLEIDPASCIHRFLKIEAAIGTKPYHMKDIIIWNLRGHAVPLDQLVPKLVRRVRDMHLDAIIIDPIYKVITGDENSASDMAAFCNQFDKICNETGCSVIYCHHHSKGAQGMKRAIDRASGSGVFARDPDAQLDMIELELSDEVKNFVAERGATAWRMESSLREFPNFKPVNFWFEYPIHRLDNGEFLEEMPSQGSPEAGRMKNRHAKSTAMAENEFRNAYNALSIGEEVTV
ncbi:MAG: AAA family ATPase, partial [Clostridia bacterium]|nr:AAA family ATPase [Clostridia bacterium]